MESEFVYVIWGVAAILLLNLAFQAFRNKGLKGALFGARIGRTVGEVDIRKGGSVRSTLKVHRLESKGPGTPTIGIELVNRSFAAISMVPISLTSEQAIALAQFLSQAAAEG